MGFNNIPGVDGAVKGVATAMGRNFRIAEMFGAEGLEGNLNSIIAGDMSLGQRNQQEIAASVERGGI